MISVLITSSQNVRFLTELSSSSTKIQINNEDCSLINKEQPYQMIQTTWNPLYKITV